ncbi:MAG: hypothetical protein M1813_008877 [Trichoglossum hirsutum]|nr:MAG: hypothetical protein M1813_008877 [Trichoglossum hirsutum]
MFLPPLPFPQHRRDSEPDGTKNHGDIERRVLPQLPAGPQLDAYIMNSAENSRLVFGRSSLVNTAGFASLPRRYALDIGLRRLCGCTVLFIYNPTGVYYAHLWEDQSFGRVMQGAASSTKFFNEVELLLLYGNNARGYPSLSVHAPELNNANTHAFIMTPLRDRPPRVGPQYPVDIQRLQAVISQILPLANVAQVREYDAVDWRLDEQLPLANQQLETTTKGCFLFQFDPGPPPLPAQVRLYIENTPIF